MVEQQEMTLEAKSDAQSIQELQAEALDGGRVPDGSHATKAIESLQDQYKRQEEAPPELSLARETERLTAATPMGAYAQQFKMEQELDRRALRHLSWHKR